MIPIYLTDALRDCQQALQTQDENQNNWGLLCQHLGNILQGMGWFEESTTWHSRIIETVPDPLKSYNDLGKIYLKLEMWQQAMDVYKQILELNPKYAEAYLYLANIYENLGLKHPANEYWYQTLLLQPDLLNGFNTHNLGKSYLDQGELEKATNCYMAAIKKNPKNSASYSDLAEIFIQQKQWDKAIEYYNKIIKIDPQQLDVFVKLGNVYLEQKMFDRAVPAFQQAIKLEPNNLNYYLSLNKALMINKRWDDVIGVSQKAIQIFPQNSWPYVYLANALVKKGEKDKAIENFQKICELREWKQCISKGYEFTEDNFTHNINIWKEHLGELVKQEGLQCLEVMCLQGMNACWLLDNILKHPTAKLTCLDDKFSPEFGVNIKKTKALKKVQKITGSINRKLTLLPKNNYDLISVKYRNKKTIQSQRITALTWQLLKVGGIIILQEYEVGNNKSAAEQPRKGINKFFQTVKGKYEVLTERRQLIIKKIAE